jgi:dephospho-CoA kinase
MTLPQDTKPVIGLIGGIGSGKSTVARLFAEMGCGVIDADAVARQALEDPEVKAQLVQWWSQAILDSRGRIDRAAVGRIVFARPTELHRLEALVHPVVHAHRRQLRARMFADPQIKAIIEDTPLLLEKHLDGECDLLVFVAAARAVRLQRLHAGRGWTAGELAAREKNQLRLDIKAKLADHVIDNNADEAESLIHVRRVLSQILQKRN